MEDQRQESTTRSGPGAGAACPLCAPARARPEADSDGAPPAKLDEDMVRHFGIAETWLGWPVCARHQRDYQTAAAKAANSALRREQHLQKQHSNKRRRKEEAMELDEASKPDKEQEKPEGQQRDLPDGMAQQTEPTLQERTTEVTDAKRTKKMGKKSKRNAPLDPIPLRPIGLFESCFLERHGTPRQGLLVPSSRGSLTLRRSDALTNPHDALVGLEGFSHVWIVFLFHNNAGNPQNKIQPPRLGGRKLGMLATRTPHRPCPIGLSVARVEAIEGDTLHLSGVDLVNNTPVLDIKPYIGRYDAIPDAITAEWLAETDRSESASMKANEDEKEEGEQEHHDGIQHEGRLRVVMTSQALDDLQRHAGSLRFFRDDWRRAQKCIEEVLALDIRTLHMKRKHKEGTYGVSIDLMNVSFTVDSEAGVCTVQRIELWPESYDFADFGEVKRRRVAAAKEEATPQEEQQ